jgi:hypothetical protein
METVEENRFQSGKARSERKSRMDEQMEFVHGNKPQMAIL